MKNILSDAENFLNYYVIEEDKFVAIITSINGFCFVFDKVALMDVKLGL